MVLQAQADFNKIIASHDESVDWYVNTEVIDAQSGDPAESFGAKTAISALITKVTTTEIHNSMGTLTNAHYWMYTKSTRAIAIRDKIVKSTVTYFVENIDTKAYDEGTLAFQKFLVRRQTADA